MDFNILSDMTIEELVATKTGFRISNFTYPRDPPYSELPDMFNNDTAPLTAAEDEEGALRNLQSIPSSHDWRTATDLYPKGCVTPVQDQGRWSVRIGRSSSIVVQ